MTIYGYVRVSTDKQETGSDAQRRALEAAGCETIIEERASGRKARPALAKLIANLAPTDTIMVQRFDRISRGVADFYAIGQEIRARGASLRSLFEQFDTDTPMGRAMMGFAAVWAELEADTTRERVMNGLLAARARGVKLGRRSKLGPEAEDGIRSSLARGVPTKHLARVHKVSRSAIWRIKKRETEPTLR